MSMFGSLLIIVTYLLMKSLRKFPTNLVFYLSVCDFIFSLKFFITRYVYVSSVGVRACVHICVLVFACGVH